MSEVSCPNCNEPLGESNIAEQKNLSRRETHKMTFLGGIGNLGARLNVRCLDCGHEFKVWSEIKSVE